LFSLFSPKSRERQLGGWSHLVACKALEPELTLSMRGVGIHCFGTIYYEQTQLIFCISVKPLVKPFWRDLPKTPDFEVRPRGASINDFSSLKFSLLAQLNWFKQGSNL
jgi:hypothetical protein